VGVVAHRTLQQGPLFAYPTTVEQFLDHKTKRCRTDGT
jgi:hypothetical protein